MTREVARIDISTMPDLARLAREVARDGRRRVLQEGSTDIAVLSPVRSSRRRARRVVTQADIDAALATFGAWRDTIDTEQLKRELDEARSDNRTPVEL
jgi:hypothetical protein